MSLQPSRSPSLFGRPAVLAEAAEMAGSPHVRVALVDRETRVLRVARIKGELVSAGFEYPLEGSLSGLVVTSGESVFSPDVQTDPRSHFGPRYRDLGIVTYLGLPIKSRGEVVGVLNFHTTEPRRVHSRDVGLPANARLPGGHRHRKCATVRGDPAPCRGAGDPGPPADRRIGRGAAGQGGIPGQDVARAAHPAQLRPRLLRSPAAGDRGAAYPEAGHLR